MPGLFWDTEDLNATKADDASSRIKGLLDDFTSRWQHMAQPQQPAAPAPMPMPEAPAPKREPMTFDVKAFTPWAQRDEPKPDQPATPTATPEPKPAKDTNAFSLDAFTPWVTSKLGLGSAPETPSSSTPTPPASPSASAMPTGGNDLGQQAAQATATTDQQVHRLTTPSTENAAPIDNSSRASFVKTAYPYMLQAAGGNKDAAEMMLAAAISENGSVGSGRPFWANNFFGIKGRGDAGSANAATWEAGANGERQNINDDFAAYSSPVAGMGAFFDFLKNNSRYAPALANYQKTGDAVQLFRDVNAAGYATDKGWADKVANIRANQVAPITQSLDAQVPAPMPKMSMEQPANDPTGGDTPTAIDQWTQDHPLQEDVGPQNRYMPGRTIVPVAQAQTGGPPWEQNATSAPSSTAPATSMGTAGLSPLNSNTPTTPPSD